MKTLLCLLPLLALNAFAAAPPANDYFANRTALVSSGSISIADRNASATTEANEPTVAGDVVSRSVWYSWTAPFTGPVTVSTAGSSFDTLLGVFTGTALGALTSIAENDDAGTGAYTSKVNFNAVAGIPYVVLIGGFNGAGGKIRLTITVGSGPCTYSVTPTSKSFSNTAGSGSVAVTTTTGCSWSATSNDSFISVTSGSTGSGSSTVTYAVLANTALTARVGTMTIAGATVTIDQAAAPACTYNLSPTSTNAPSDSVTNSVFMTAGTGCAWNATPNASWISIISGASGTGSGNIGYVLAANTNSNQRVSTITAAGQAFTITQSGVLTCTYSISPPSGSFASAGGSSNIVISTITGCAWTASSPVTWATFSTVNGTGNATVTYTVAANTNTVSRSTTLTVAGRPYAVSQTGTACSYSLLPSSLNVAATAGSSSVSVAAGAGCAWTAVANASWLTITAGTSGTGSGSVVFTIAANVNTVARAGTLTIAGLTFTVNQAAAACIYSIAPTAAHYVAAGGPGNIAVTAGTGCAWTAVANDAWITVDSGSPGTGNGVVGYTVAPNVTAVSCTGTITVAGQIFTITQDGTAPCTYSILPANASFTSLGGTNSVAVTANAGCTWSVSSGATWLTFTPASGSGNGTVTYTVGANSSSLTRTGTLTVAGQTFTVTQTGVSCIYGIIPTSASYTSTGGNGTVAVTATQGCNWTSSSDSPWLVVTSGTAGVGNGSVGYSVAAATNSTTRTGRLTIATKLLIVTQTGAACTFALTPATASIGAAGGGGSLGLTTSDNACAWTASSNAPWLTVSPSSGTGTFTLAYSATPTAITASRIGVITAAGQTFTVTQSGDTTAPTVTLTSPSNGSTISNVFTLTATASDDVSVSRVDFYRDSATLIGTDATSPYSVPFNTTNLVNGSHTFYASGFDPAGNQGFSTTNTVTISNSAVVSTNLWVQSFGSSGSEVPKAVAVNAAGDIFVAGTFTATFTIGSTTLTNGGSQDIFIARFTSNGTSVWAKRFGSTGSESVISLVLDSSDNIFIGGLFSGAGNFGGSTVNSVGGSDGFMARYSSAGVFVWSRTLGSTTGDAVNSVALGTAGQTNLLAAGYFSGTVVFTPSTTFTSQSGGSDSFLANYAASDGTPIWARTWGSLDYDVASHVFVDSGNNTIVVGTFGFQVNFGNGVLAAYPGTRDIYLAKFAPSGGSAPGAATWSKKYGTISDNTVYSAALDSGGGIAVGGIFTGSTDVGSGVITGGGPSYSAFVAKYLGSTGANVWSRALSGNSGVIPYGIAFDPSNNVTVTGSFAGTCNFGSQTFTTSGSTDIYTARYSSAAGTPIWAQTYGGADGDSGIAIAVDGTDHTIVAGYYSGTANFSGSSLTSSGGSIDMFLMRIKP